jgi:hypothetical protein
MLASGFFTENTFVWIQLAMMMAELHQSCAVLLWAVANATVRRVFPPHLIMI